MTNEPVTSPKKARAAVDSSTKADDSTLTRTYAPIAPDEFPTLALPEERAVEVVLPRIPGYEVLGELGRGGMGIVYLARQLSLNRKVALKVLPPALACDPLLLKRFRNEAEVAARLNDCRIVPVIDIIETEGTPILVMPFVEGCDLNRILVDRHAVRQGNSAGDPHPWALLADRAYLDHMLPLLDMVLESVVALHHAGVLHRDIKPSNILIDQRNNAWLSDFGLARLQEQAGVTLPGQGLGTRGYMGPEQWDAQEDADQSVDLFSVGATLYKALTLELPYGTGRISLDTPLPLGPSKRQPLLAREFDIVILKALEPERRNRYASAAELQEDWRRVRHGQDPKARRAGWGRRIVRTIRRRRATALAVVLLLICLVLIALLQKNPQKPLSPAEASKIGLRDVSIQVEPAQGNVVLVPHDENGLLQPDRRLRPDESDPLTFHGVAPGYYLVVVDIPDFGFHEVFRTVPEAGRTATSPLNHRQFEERADGTVVLPPIVVHRQDTVQGMARFPGGKFTMGDDRIPGAAEHTQRVAAFDLDTAEVTVAEYRDVQKGLPAALLRRKIRPDDKAAISFVTFDEALEYAERKGKRLPYEAEFEYAATNAGKSRYPWGSDPDRIKSWSFGPVRQPEYDHTDTTPPVYGLFSNVAEWTLSPQSLATGTDIKTVQTFGDLNSEPLRQLFRNAQIIRGAASPVADGNMDISKIREGGQWDPRYRHGVNRNAALEGLGFRCARSAAAPFMELPAAAFKLGKKAGDKAP